MADPNVTWRARFYDLLEETERSSPLEKIINLFLVTVIVGSVTAICLETLPSLHDRYAWLFQTIEIATIAHETPSPFAASLLFDFVAVSMYAGDASPEGRAPSGAPLSPTALHDILPETAIPGTLRPDAVALVQEVLDLDADHIEPAPKFWRAEEYHQRYLQKRGQSHCAV